MKEEILARARFLLTDLHLSPPEAATRLAYYFPDLEHEERSRHIHEASVMLGEATRAGRADQVH